MLLPKNEKQYMVFLIFFTRNYLFCLFPFKFPRSHFNAYLFGTSSTTLGFM